MSVSEIQSITKAAIAKARAEIAQEKVDKAVKLLKDKYRQLEAAKTVVANIEREIADAEGAIEQGNLV